MGVATLSSLTCSGLAKKVGEKEMVVDPWSVKGLSAKGRCFGIWQWVKPLAPFVNIKIDGE